MSDEALAKVPGGYRCPECSERTIVIDSRPIVPSLLGESGMRRKRECLKCFHQFVTLEKACVSTPSPKELRPQVGSLLNSRGRVDRVNVIGDSNKKRR